MPETKHYIAMEDRVEGTPHEDKLLDFITLAELVRAQHLNTVERVCELIGDHPVNMQGELNVFAIKGDLPKWTAHELGQLLLAVRQVSEFAEALHKLMNHFKYVVSCPAAIKLGLDGGESNGELATFGVSFDVTPHWPSEKQDANAHQEFIDDVKSRRPDLVKEQVSWKDFRAYVKELVEAGKPLPKHCGTFMKPTVSVRSKR